MLIPSTLNSTAKWCIHVFGSSLILTSRDSRNVSSSFKPFHPLPAFLFTPLSFFLTTLMLQTVLTDTPTIFEILFRSTSVSRRSETFTVFIYVRSSFVRF
uniref:Uncharacterized protein n=1 Tax=Lepeophtheirus salmonis TaxID=72036 RepID=A0A0K2VEY2_LEPSM